MQAWGIVPGQGTELASTAPQVFMPIDMTCPYLTDSSDGWQAMHIMDDNLFSKRVIT